MNPAKTNPKPTPARAGRPCRLGTGPELVFQGDAKDLLRPDAACPWM